ncbi:hypothetical protein ACFVX6_38160 [Streptomyces sp. NPDC058289]|uniref:hypothetical protein n=1 Tax=Streptomyces sp. NPDC058289 TaxID=3346425 RepID=UPI0036ECE72B
MAVPRHDRADPSPWPVACFKLTDPNEGDPDALHTRIARRVQDNGHVYLATVAVQGRPVLRAALCNCRTTTDDLDLLFREALHAVDTEDSARRDRLLRFSVRRRAGTVHGPFGMPVA